MLRDGLYDRFGTPDVVLGQHVGPLPAGMVFHRPGPMMAATLSLDVAIFGRGGHGSRPETTVDPVVVGAYIVTRLQTIVSREIEPLQPAVVTVGEFHAGTKANVIPDEARLAINIRSFDDRVQRHVVSAIERIVQCRSRSGSLSRPPDITRSDGGPVTATTARWSSGSRLRTSPGSAQAGHGHACCRRWAARTSGCSPTPTAIPRRRATIPTGFWFWGGASDEQIAAAPGQTMLEKIASLPSNHHPGFMVDPEPTLRTGVEALTVAALAYLAP